MRLDQALNIKVGDIVYNCFMDELVVTSRFDSISDNGSDIRNIIFSTVDTRLSRSTYQFDDLYHKDLDGESDEEKSFISWAKENRDFFLDDCFTLMKECYKQGFAMGFAHKRKITFEEMMQK